MIWWNWFDTIWPKGKSATVNVTVKDTFARSFIAVKNGRVDRQTCHCEINIIIGIFPVTSQFDYLAKKSIVWCIQFDASKVLVCWINFVTMHHCHRRWKETHYFFRRLSVPIQRCSIALVSVVPVVFVVVSTLIFARYIPFFGLYIIWSITNSVHDFTI